MVPPSDPRRSGQKQTPQPDKAIPKGNSNAPKKPANPLLPILLVVGFLMLVAAAWLTYRSINVTRELEQKVAELQEAEKLRAELENQYNEAIAELDLLKGDNEQINALIDQQKAELMAQKNEISVLLRDKRRYDAARAEIRDLKTRVAEYVAEIEQLKAEQEMLAQENVMLKDVRDSLNTSLQAKLGENEALSVAKAQLVNEKQGLEKSVEVGSVVMVKEIEVTGQKVRRSGKTAEKDKAKKVDQLKVCFTTVVNDLVSPGKEEFFIRIIHPGGETLAIDDLGSGTIVLKRTGEELPYTQVKAYDYANDETQLCFLWNPNMPFESGKYDVEIYNKGYLAGTGEFELQ